MRRKKIPEGKKHAGQENNRCRGDKPGVIQKTMLLVIMVGGGSIKRGS